MNSFEIFARDLPLKQSDIDKNIRSIKEGPKGRVFIHCQEKAIIELDPKTFKKKGKHFIKK